METGTAVLSFGLRPESLFSEQTEVSAFLEPAEEEGSERLPRELVEVIERGDHAIAIAPEWLEGRGPELLETATSALETTRVATHRTSLPPLAGGVLVSIAAALASAAPYPGAVIALLPRIERELHVFAWLANVSRLSDPAPTVLQHVASLWPSTAFVATTWPEPSVQRLSPRHATVQVPTADYPVGLVIAADQPDGTWIDLMVVPALGSPEVKRVPPTPQGPGWWGTRQLVESVAYPASIDAIAGELAGIELVPCRWCDEPIASWPCPFCGAADPSGG